MSSSEERLRVVIGTALVEDPPPSDAEGRQVAIAAGTVLGVSPTRSIQIFEEERCAQNGRLLGRLLGLN